jgi:hypothetical protein
LGFLQAESFLPWSSVSVCTGFFLSRASACGRVPSRLRVFLLTFFVSSGFDSYSERATRVIDPQLFFPLEFGSAVGLSTDSSVFVSCAGQSRGHHWPSPVSRYRSLASSGSSGCVLSGSVLLRIGAGAWLDPAFEPPAGSGF